MSDATKMKFFTNEQMQHLILSYMYGCANGGPAVQVPTEDIAAFLSACEQTIIEAESIRMVADGLLFVQWDKESGEFAFEISDAGVREAERQRQ